MSKESKDKTPQITHTPARSTFIYVIIYTDPFFAVSFFLRKEDTSTLAFKNISSGDNLAICDESEPKPGGLKMGPAGV